MRLLCCSRTVGTQGPRTFQERSLHRQGRAGCCPVVLVGTASTARMQHHTHHSWVFPSTRFMLSSRLRSRFFLSLRFAYRRHFHVVIMLPVSRFVCLRVFTFYVSVCICGGIHADVIETAFSSGNGTALRWRPDRHEVILATCDSCLSPLTCILPSQPD